MGVLGGDNNMPVFGSLLVLEHNVFKYMASEHVFNNMFWYQAAVTLQRMTLRANCTTFYISFFDKILGKENNL